MRVRVIEVDMRKKRISLSMREGRAGVRKGPKDKRAQAIGNLDKLFKK